MKPRAWNSALYFGRVRHARAVPIRHAFEYGHFLAALDLSELPELFRGRWLWSAERANLASFRRADYLGDPATPLDEAVRELVERRTGTRPTGRILLLTQLRQLGFVFNPVSFYFCLDAAGRVETIVAEITNTPWGERHAYVLAARDALPAEGNRLRFRFPKQFHISPFFPMEQEYEWEFTPPAEELGVVMRNLEAGRVVFQSEMRLARRPWTGREAARALCLHPAMSLRTIAAIYWQALRLRLRGAPFFEHPGRRGETAASPVTNTDARGPSRTDTRTASRPLEIHR